MMQADWANEAVTLEPNPSCAHGFCGTVLEKSHPVSEYQSHEQMNQGHFAVYSVWRGFDASGKSKSDETMDGRDFKKKQVFQDWKNQTMSNHIMITHEIMTYGSPLIVEQYDRFNY